MVTAHSDIILIKYEANPIKYEVSTVPASYYVRSSFYFAVFFFQNYSKKCFLRKFSCCRIISKNLLFIKWQFLDRNLALLQKKYV